MTSRKRVIIVSISSDIGTAMALDMVEKGYEVLGTYRTWNSSLGTLQQKGIKLFQCDLIDKEVPEKLAAFVRTEDFQWDVLVLAPGAQEPVGFFAETEFPAWADSIQINFIGQLGVTHALLPMRRSGKSLEPLVLFFAGGGTNNATVSYSAYTISKIALIKMCELLDAEIPDTRFAIVGPGWVKTKIHDATLEAGERAGANFARTKEKLASDECTPMAKVVDCCNWLIDASRKAISGRNFSVVFDPWGTDELTSILEQDPNVYKLRRFGNDIAQDRLQRP